MSRPAQPPTRANIEIQLQQSGLNRSLRIRTAAVNGPTKASKRIKLLVDAAPDAEVGGDRWIVAVGEHNLGNATLGLGEFAEACTHFDAARQVYEAYNDQWSVALLAEDVVLLALALDRWEIAAQLVGAADALRERLDAPRPPAVSSTLDAAIDPGREWWLTIGVTAAQAGRDRGEMVLGEAIQDLALSPLSVASDAM